MRQSPLKLDQTKIQDLLEGADKRWFKNHSGQFNYREHLAFTAEHIAKNYYKESRSRPTGKTKEAPPEE